MAAAARRSRFVRDELDSTQLSGLGGEVLLAGRHLVQLEDVGQRPRPCPPCSTCPAHRRASPRRIQSNSSPTGWLLQFARNFSPTQLRSGVAPVEAGCRDSRCRSCPPPSRRDTPAPRCRRRSRRSATVPGLQRRTSGTAAQTTALATASDASQCQLPHDAPTIWSDWTLTRISAPRRTMYPVTRTLWPLCGSGL